MQFEIIFAAAGILYAILIACFTIGWYRLPAIWPEGTVSVRFSVVVAVRNEEANIIKLLEALRAQKYPAGLFEVIVVDDFSTDSTPQLVAQRLASGLYNNFRLIRAAEISEKSGKKNAITIGVKHSNYDWIITTDADCVFGRHWLHSFSGFIESQNPEMVIGQVVVTAGDSLFSQLQALEFMSLAGATAGSAAIGRPVMCNGANLAFRSELFERVGGYQGNDQYASGDDMFLLQKFKKNNGAKVLFLKSHGALVYTRPVERRVEFLAQRARWAGKAGGYRDGFTLITAFAVAAINLLIAGGIVLGLVFSANMLLAALLLFVFKAVVDFPLLWGVTGFLRKHDLMWLYPALAMIYPFYVASALATGFIAKPKWKS